MTRRFGREVKFEEAGEAVMLAWVGTGGLAMAVLVGGAKRAFGLDRRSGRLEPARALGRASVVPGGAGECPARGLMAGQRLCLAGQAGQRLAGGQGVCLTRGTRARRWLRTGEKRYKKGGTLRSGPPQQINDYIKKVSAHRRNRCKYSIPTRFNQIKR